MIKTVLYMLPEKVAAGEFAAALPFLKKESIEVWTEFSILEVTLSSGALTLEDITEEINGEKEKELLASLKVGQVYACDYDSADAEAVQKIAGALTEKFGGFFASDTEDGRPFLKVEEL